MNTVFELFNFRQPSTMMIFCFNFHFCTASTNSTSRATMLRPPNCNKLIANYKRRRNLCVLHSRSEEVVRNILTKSLLFGSLRRFPSLISSLPCLVTYCLISRTTPLELIIRMWYQLSTWMTQSNLNMLRALFLGSRHRPILVVLVLNALKAPKKPLLPRLLLKCINCVLLGIVSPTRVIKIVTSQMPLEEWKPMLSHLPSETALFETEDSNLHATEPL